LYSSAHCTHHKDHSDASGGDGSSSFDDGVELIVLGHFSHAEMLEQCWRFVPASENDTGDKRDGVDAVTLCKHFFK